MWIISSIAAVHIPLYYITLKVPSTHTLLVGSIAYRSMQILILRLGLNSFLSERVGRTHEGIDSRNDGSLMRWSYRWRYLTHGRSSVLGCWFLILLVITERCRLLLIERICWRSSVWSELTRRWCWWVDVLWWRKRCFYGPIVRHCPA